VKKKRIKNGLALKEKSGNVIIPVINRCEVNFLKYPYFNVVSKSKHMDCIEINDIERMPDGYKEIYWRVSRSMYYDFPGAFARRIHTEIVTPILNWMPKPIPRLIKLGSLYEMCKVLGIVYHSKNRNDIKKALESIAATTIKTKGTFCIKDAQGNKKFIEEKIIHLYEAVYFRGAIFPNGNRADETTIVLSHEYAHNFNRGYVAPLDFSYIKSLHSSVAQRLYELLNIWLYPVLENKSIVLAKKYSTLCSYAPLVKQNKIWLAKQQLKSSHEQLINSNYISSVEWESIGKNDDWLIKYHIGQRAIDWYNSTRRKVKSDNLLSYKQKISDPGRPPEQSIFLPVEAMKEEDPAKWDDQINAHVPHFLQKYPGHKENQQYSFFRELVEQDLKRMLAEKS